MTALESLGLVGDLRAWPTLHEVWLKTVKSSRTKRSYNSLSDVATYVARWFHDLPRQEVVDWVDQLHSLTPEMWIGPREWLEAHWPEALQSDCEFDAWEPKRAAVEELVSSFLEPNLVLWSRLTV
jgi:hypothetical protein